MVKRLLLLPLLLVVVSSTLMAQTTTGTIRGDVNDAKGAPLPGVTITVVGPQGVERVVTSTGDGNFLVSSLPPGAYTLTATLEHMQPQNADQVRVTIGGVTTIRFTLHETLAEEVTVTAEAPLLDLASTKMSTNYDSKLLEELPTRRNFWDMVSSSPGMSGSTEWTSQQSAFGSSVTSNSWNVDGLNVTGPETGNAWLYVNPETIDELQVLGIGAPAEFGNMTGAAINVVTKSGTNQFHGSANAFLQYDSLTDTNVTIDDDPDYAVNPSYKRDEYYNTTATFGGPIVKDRFWFFTAGEWNLDSEAEPGVDPNFPAQYAWTRYDVKLDANFGIGTQVNAKGHWEDYRDTDSGNAFITNSARGESVYDNPAWGAEASHVLSSNTLLEAGYAGWWSSEHYRSLTGSRDSAFAAFSNDEPTRYSGGLTFPFDYYTSVNQVDLKASHYADDFLHGDHDFRFGIGYNSGSADTVSKASETGNYFYSYTYHYEDGSSYSYYYNYTFRPFHYGGKQTAQSAFVDDSWRFNDDLTLNLGVRYDHTNGRIPHYEELDFDAHGTGNDLPAVKDVIDWNTVSPRLGAAWVATSDQKTVVRGSFGVYHDGSVMGNWDYPPPGLPPIQLFQCDGPQENCTSLIDETTFPTNLNVDPDLKPPQSLQYALGVERQLTDTFVMGLTGVYKQSKDLIGWEVLDDGVYEQVPYTNPFTGETYQLLSLCDEGCRPATIRKGNRPGKGSLAPDDDYHQTYRALMLTFNRRFAGRWSMQGSYTWSRSEGLIPRPQTQGQGAPLYGSLDGSDPNQWINADQLLQNDRTHMFRIQGYVQLPWKIDASANLNWQTGRPYARLARVRGLGQGTQTIIVEPTSNDRRLPSTTMLDISLGKKFALPRDFELELGFDVFNVLNEDANTSWNSQVVGVDQHYVADNWVWPRRAMVRLGLRF